MANLAQEQIQREELVMRQFINVLTLLIDKFLVNEKTSLDCQQQEITPPPIRSSPFKKRIFVQVVKISAQSVNS